MHSAIKFLIGLLFLAAVSVTNANTQAAAWFSRDGENQVKIHVDLFFSSSCPHCQKANEFFRTLALNKPWLVTHAHYIDQDKPALQRFYERLQQQGIYNYAVPAIFFCDSHWVGFADAASSGKILLQAMTYCRQQVSKQGELSKATVTVLRQRSMANQLQLGDVARSPARLIPLLALADAFSACSFFCLMAFLAFLWLTPKQRWWQFFSGISFIFSLAGVNYIQQAHTAIFYQTIHGLRWPAAIVGFVLLLYSLSCGRKIWRGIEIKHAPHIYILIILTAITVQIYQQTCGLNLALVFEQWLAEQAVSVSRNALYQLIYQIFYALPLLLLLAFYLLFGQYRRISRFENALKVSATLILLVIGVLLAVYPQFLANLLLSSIVLLGSLFFGWLFIKRNEQ